jgi:hypothetical protein
VSTLVTILDSPSASPTPTPAPTATATPMPTLGKPIELQAQNVASLKIPKSIKVSGKFTVAKFSSAGLPIKMLASGNCSVVSSAKNFTVTATKKTGNCKLKVSNTGNDSYLALNQQVTVKVTR